LADAGSCNDLEVSEDHTTVANPIKSLANAEDGVTAAFELVLTPALFAFLGYLVDRWAGVGPLCVFIFGGVVATYEIWKLWYTYTERMKALEADLPDAKGNHNG
tara:strand:- start:561 stop:872 length:312 start_codon:yes stop_codon:yes gene_type:complete